MKCAECENKITFIGYDKKEFCCIDCLDKYRAKEKLKDIKKKIQKKKSEWIKLPI